MDKQKVLEEIHQFWENRDEIDILPDELTFAEIMEFNHIGRTQAEKLMKDLVGQGRFSRRRSRGGFAVFRRLDGPPGEKRL